MIRSYFIFIVVFFMANFAGSCDTVDPTLYTVEDFYGIWKLDPEEESRIYFPLYLDGFIMEADDRLRPLFINNITSTTPDNWKWRGPELPLKGPSPRYMIDLEEMTFTMYEKDDKSDKYPLLMDLEIISLDRIKLTNPVTGEEDVFVRDEEI